MTKMVAIPVKDISFGFIDYGDMPVLEEIPIDDKDRDILDRILRLKQGFFTHKEIADILHVSVPTIIKISKKYDMCDEEHPLHTFRSKDKRRLYKKVYFHYKIKGDTLPEIAIKLNVPLHEVRSAIWFIKTQEILRRSRVEYLARLQELENKLDDPEAIR